MPPLKTEYSSGNTRTRTACAAFSAVWSLLAILVIFLFPAFFDNVNSKIYDWKLSLSHVRNLSPEIVHLDIDDQAIKEFGHWPWDRALSARIVERLSEFQAKLVVFDIFYASPGKSEEGNSTFFEAIKRARNVVSATVVELSDTHEKKVQVDGDPARADAVYDASWPVQVPPTFRLWRVKELRSSLLPLLPVIQFSRGIGHIAATPDSDGTYRRMALLVSLEDRCIPSLSLSALLAYWNLTPAAVTLLDGKEMRIRKGTDEIAIPVDRRGMMLINWGNPWTSFKHYSVSDVMSEEPDLSRATRYKGKIVVVDVTATGNTDVCTTPLSANAPLNRIHSHALNTIITQSFIRHVRAFPWLVIISAVLAITFPIMASRVSLRLEAVLLVLIGTIFVLVGTVCFVLWAYDIALAEVTTVFVPAAIGSIALRGVSAERQVVKAKRALERYLPPELVDGVISDGKGPDLSGRRLEVTIVFVDMQRFSTLSETVDVEYITRFLKDFFEGMSRAIVKQRGRIHQFLGDGFLAVFGDLIAVDDHAAAAVRAALDMQKEMVGLNSRWSNSGIRELEKGLNIRIGINTGVVFVGDLGSDRRLEYAVVGSAVNIASRLQSLAPPGGIMMTSRTKALLGDFDLCRGPESVRLKGIDRDMEVYSIKKVV